MRTPAAKAPIFPGQEVVQLTEDQLLKMEDAPAPEFTEPQLDAIRTWRAASAMVQLHLRQERDINQEVDLIQQRLSDAKGREAQALASMIRALNPEPEVE